MVIDIIGGVVLAFLLIAAFFKVAEYLWNKYHGRERQTRRRDDTAHLSHYFTRKYGTITFPNGDTKDVTYDERVDKKDGRTFLKINTPECFSVSQQFRSGRPALSSEKTPPEDEQMFSLSNIRGIEVRRTDDMVAGVSVDVEHKEERYGEDGSWSHEHTYFDRHEDHEVGIWYESEWKAHISDD